ncbi:MAG TPA: DNA polymerase III subunit gamma/tau [Candidatus Magasanikbacteria bacterium]|jgi:DNA polymerase-3 subunit gamma/tau|nr:DNA polymerase III subunit gamma/tau [Candidatus Magasanikbacteria bacterium]HQL52466.1 DNA polymerase III subunit gamma/tau [Candidatus Magasanikbacteria bacterium]
MALYLKYRPQDFSSIIGQEHIVKTISNQIIHNKINHAYLFSGPRGVGKTTLARVIAKAVNCENRQDKNFDPCNQCSSCQEITHSRAIDVIEIDAASHTGVDNVKENIIDNVQFKPTKSKYKVFIIDEVHMLSTSAFNALLKTLEEPPEHIIFILATTELHKLPATIISRCQRFAFKKIPHETMNKHLENIAKAEKIKITKEVLERIINKSDGCARDAISLLDQLMATGEKNIDSETASLVLPNTNIEKTFTFVSSLINKDIENGMNLIKSLVDDGINFNQFNIDLLELLHAMMINKADPQAAFILDVNDKVKKEIDKINQQISYTDLIILIDLIMKRSQQIRLSPIPELPLQLVLLEWCEKKENNQDDDNFTTPNKSNNEKKEVTKKEPITKENKESTNNKASLTKENKKTSFTEKVKNIVNKPIEFSLIDIEKKWTNFISQVEKEHPSLIFILKMSEILNLENNLLKIGVQYSFHANKLNDKICQRNLENIMSDILGHKIRIEAVVQEKEINQDKNDIQNLASSFGGEIIS